MTVRDVSGDLFALDVDAIGHGVNCQGVMGAGIALEFAHRYRTMETEYERRCLNDALLLGQVFPWLAGHPDLPWVYNIASQDMPGAHADLDAIEVAMRFVRFHAERHGLATVALPQIGCGIGGLDWEDVRSVIEDVCKRSPVEFQLVTYAP